MTEPSPWASPWAEPSWLLATQYRTDANLTARQSIYRYQRPSHDIARLGIDLAGLAGSERVIDVGCGNGTYLAELARRGHRGRVLGVDLSPGMLRAARARAPGAALAVADASALPLPGSAGDVTLAMHMLYHVPEPAAAVAELRRITRPGGRVLVALNGAGHLHQLRDAMDEALRRDGRHPAGARERVTLDAGERLLGRYFTSVTRHDFSGELVVPGPRPVAEYIRSMRAAQRGPDQDRLVAATLGGLATGPGGSYRITTHSGCLVCS